MSPTSPRSRGYGCSRSAARASATSVWRSPSAVAADFQPIADREQYGGHVRGLLHPLTVGAGVGPRALGLQHVVGDDDRPAGKLRVEPLERRHIHVFPYVEQHEV